MLYKNININSFTCNSTFPKLVKIPISNIFHSSSFPWTCDKQQKSLHIFHQDATHKWLVSKFCFGCTLIEICVSVIDNLICFSCAFYCGLQDSVSSDDEYCSSRNIAINPFRRYRNFIDRGGGENLKEFITAGVNACVLGCTDEGLRKELTDLKDSGIEIEAMQSYGGSTSLKSKIISEEGISSLYMVNWLLQVVSPQWPKV